MLAATGTLLAGSRAMGGAASIAGIWQVAPASTKAFTTADPSAPVPPVTTMWRSFNDCIQVSPCRLSAFVAHLWPERRRIAEYDHEQFPEQLADARIGRASGGRPGRGIGQHLIVTAVDGVEVEDAGPPRLQARAALAHGVRIEVVGGVEDQHQPVVRPRPLDRRIVGEGERRA